MNIDKRMLLSSPILKACCHDDVVYLNMEPHCYTTLENMELQRQKLIYPKDILSMTYAKRPLVSLTKKMSNLELVDCIALASFLYMDDMLHVLCAALLCRFITWTKRPNPVPIPKRLYCTFPLNRDTLADYITLYLTTIECVHKIPEDVVIHTMVDVLGLCLQRPGETGILLYRIKKSHGKRVLCRVGDADVGAAST